MNGHDGILLAGVDPRAVKVGVEWERENEECVVTAGVWMTNPRWFVPNMRVTVRWDHADGHQRFTTIGPLTADDLMPGKAGWVGYASA
jgi:hypothetical protein